MNLLSYSTGFSWILITSNKCVSGKKKTPHQCGFDPIRMNTNSNFFTFTSSWRSVSAAEKPDNSLLQDAFLWSLCHSYHLATSVRNSFVFAQASNSRKRDHVIPRDTLTHTPQLHMISVFPTLYYLQQFPSPLQSAFLQSDGVIPPIKHSSVCWKSWLWSFI